MRLERAHEFLRDIELPVAAVAVRRGFERPDQLARRYRAAYGISPRAQRGSVA